MQARYLRFGGSLISELRVSGSWSWSGFWVLGSGCAGLRAGTASRALPVKPADQLTVTKPNGQD